MIGGGLVVQGAKTRTKTEDVLRYEAAAGRNEMIGNSIYKPQIK
jgi:hypothetical protein